ncbi:hypothetical protein, partial [Paenibacillus larvae]|uniref:hypothetical protein n=1 Tax=Paenibacillus larvae TaxID=1464 RepID=UPI0039FD77EF
RWRSIHASASKPPSSGCWNWNRANSAAPVCNRPLLEREPLKVWRGMALLSLLLNLLLVVLLMKSA